MNREIKFRVWDKESKCFLFPQSKLCIDLETGYPYLSQKLGNKGNYVTLCPPESNFVFQQFTGLKDKNGKEIYEGDLLESGAWFQGYGTVEVFWNNRYSSWRVVVPGGQGNYNGAELWEGILMNGKIVGNIMENPELLKKYEKNQTPNVA